VSTRHDPASQTAAEFFADRVPEYDSLIRRAVSHYDEMTQALLFELPPESRSIVELGCGTGNLSLHLAAKFPEATLTVVDASPEMVEVTRHRLSQAAPAFAARAKFVTARFEELVHDGEADLVTSAIALHHVADKAPLYRMVHSLLRRGGRFCFADQLRMQEAGAQERHWQEFLAFWRRPGNVSETEIVELLAHSELHDHYETLGDQFLLLEQAGFGEIDAPWRNGFWCVMTATA
jgi:tRNA (cmo5U34)-methyltransferase